MIVWQSTQSTALVQADVAYWLGTAGSGPTPPVTATRGQVRLWQAGPRGVRTRIVVRSWDDDSTKT